MRARTMVRSALTSRRKSMSVPIFWPLLCTMHTSCVTLLDATSSSCSAQGCVRALCYVVVSHLVAWVPACSICAMLPVGPTCTCPQRTPPCPIPWHARTHTYTQLHPHAHMHTAARTRSPARPPQTGADAHAHAHMPMPACTHAPARSPQTGARLGCARLPPPCPPAPSLHAARWR